MEIKMKKFSKKKRRKILLDLSWNTQLLNEFGKRANARKRGEGRLVSLINTRIRRIKTQRQVLRGPA